MCYTYDNLNRVTNRIIKNECDCIISSENYTYDAAGNITDAPDSCFTYDINNRLVVFNGYSVVYDLDGNILRGDCMSFEYDSANRLIKAEGNTYTYNAEDVRIRNLCECCEDTVYTYNTNCKLSQLLEKTTNGTVTKYVYGNGLIGEETNGDFKIYHFDSRGSTVAITNECGYITDTFKYDTYGKCISRTGTSNVIFGYNGRDGVVTDDNGLIYMRARYYSPNMRRFINADILHGQISDSTSLNRYSYVNGNPVSFVDPFGTERQGGSNTSFWDLFKNSDGSYSLYDNLRHNPDNIFREQIISFKGNGPTYNLKEQEVGLGEVYFTVFNGGWEWENLDVSLLDVGAIGLSAIYDKGKISLEALASIWSPNITFSVFGVEVTVSAHLGSIGGKFHLGNGKFEAAAAYGWGASLSFDW